MGKMKISNKKKTNSGMPSWLLTAVVVVIMAGALIACLATVVNATGLIPRLTTAMKTDHFTVNKNMMSYFFQTSYGEFTSSTTYTTFESYCSLNQGDNAGLTLDKQTFGEGTYDSVMAPNFEGETWHEFFVEQTESNVTTILSYCEEADARGISLDDEDMEAIEGELEDMFTSIKYALYQNNNYNINYLYLSDKECLNYYFGQGVSQKDVKNAMKLTALASKAEAEIRAELDAAIDDDEIADTYAESPKNYELVDFLNYTFTVKYDQVSSDVLAEIGEDAKAEDHEAEILAAYEEEIKKNAKRATVLEGITDAETFLMTALGYYLEDIYDDTYDAAKTAATLEDSKKPSAEDEAAIKLAMTNKIFEELFADEAKATAIDDVEEKDEKFYAYDIEITKEYGSFLTSLKGDLYDDLYSEKEFTENYKSSYPEGTTEEDENANTKWLYSDERKAGDTYIIDDGDGADGKTITAENKSYTADVYFMVKPRYKDTTIVRNGAYMVFTAAASAQTALDALESEESIDLERFLEIAASSGAGDYMELANYAPGQLGSDEFDDWMFNSDRTKGDYSEVVTISSSYVIGYFENEGELESWQAHIKNELLQEDLTAENERVLNAYADSVVVKTKVMSKIGK